MQQPVTIETLKYGGIPHYTYPMQLLASSPEGVILEGAFGRVLVHHTKGFTIPVQNRSLEFFWPDRPYNVAADMTPDGHVTKYYCNVALPPTVLEDRIRMVDLDLDLLVGADLSYEVVDRDDFEQNAVRYGYPPEVVEGAEAALRELIGLVESRAFPFDGTAERLAAQLDAPAKQKVVAYITRPNGDRRELLVFDHEGIPEAGTQVPAGTVEQGEAPELAVLREAFEESGLGSLAIVRTVGRFSWYAAPRQELHERHVFHLEATEPLPDGWTHTVSAGDEDKGLQFRYYWIDVDEAPDRLSGDQGAYIRHLIV